MDEFSRRCELEALVTEREKTRGHNDYCNATQTRCDNTYSELADFDSLAARMRKLATPKEESRPVEVPDWILGGLADALDAVRDRIPMPPRRAGDWSAQSRARRFWLRVEYPLCVARNALITALWWLEDHQ